MLSNLAGVLRTIGNAPPRRLSRRRSNNDRNNNNSPPLERHNPADGVYNGRRRRSSAASLGLSEIERLRETTGRWRSFGSDKDGGGGGGAVGAMPRINSVSASVNAGGSSPVKAAALAAMATTQATAAKESVI